MDFFHNNAKQLVAKLPELSIEKHRLNKEKTNRLKFSLALRFNTSELNWNISEKNFFMLTDIFMLFIKLTSTYVKLVNRYVALECDRNCICSFYCILSPHVQNV